MPNASIQPAPSSGAQDRLELKITSDPANLRPVRNKVETFARDAGMPIDACNALGLCVNEALANVIRHGYQGAKDKPIVVTIQKEATGVRLMIRDWATPWDPTRVPLRDPNRVEPGGLGLLCMRQLMDEVQFIAQSDGMLLIMFKRGDKSEKHA